MPPEEAPAGWSPPLGAVIGAVFWPVALLVAIEMIARVDWPAGRRWIALRFVGLLPVAAVAAVVSYRHMSGLLASYNEDALTALIGPFAIDGLMVISAGALLATRPVATALGWADVPAENEAETAVATTAATVATTARPALPLVARPVLAASAPRREELTVKVPFGRRDKGPCDCGCGGKAVSYDTWKRHHPVAAGGA